jgi:septal ring-binding cell division protein DamX
MTTLSGNQNSAALFVVLIPLVLGLQMAALWVMANASNSEPEMAAQLAPLTSLASPQEGGASFDQKRSVKSKSAASTSATPASAAASSSEPEDTVPRMETGLASNVMIPMTLQSTPESESDQATAQDTLPTTEQNFPHMTLEPAAEEAPSSSPETFVKVDEEPVNQNPGLQKPEWLQTRASGHYTMQVERFNDLDDLQAFTKRVTLPQPQAYYRQSTGQTWYVLVAGEYTDQQVALQAAAELTQQYPAVKPWVRRFRKIQAQLP